MIKSSKEKVQRLTVGQVAERLAISPRQVTRLIDAGELPAILISLRNAKRKTYVVDLQDLEAFERARITQPPAPRARRQVRQSYPVYTN